MMHVAIRRVRILESEFPKHIDNHNLNVVITGDNKQEWEFRSQNSAIYV